MYTPIYPDPDRNIRLFCLKTLSVPYPSSWLLPSFSVLFDILFSRLVYLTGFKIRVANMAKKNVPETVQWTTSGTPACSVMMNIKKRGRKMKIVRCR